MIKTKSIYDEKDTSDGTRILIMRKWPRGIKKDKIDEWDKSYAPSEELLADWNNDRIPFKGFKSRYLKEMKLCMDKIKELSKRAKSETLTLLCHERDDKYCHRKMLKEFIEKYQSTQKMAGLRNDK